MVRVAQAAALVVLTVPAYAGLVARQGIPNIKGLPPACANTCQPLISKLTDGCFQSLPCSCNRTFSSYLRSCAECVQSADPSQINVSPDVFVKTHSDACTAGGYPIDPNGDITLTGTTPSSTGGPTSVDSVSRAGPTVSDTVSGVTSNTGVTGTGTSKPTGTGTSGGTGSGGTGGGGTGSGGTGSGSGGSSSGGSGNGSGGGSGSSGTSPSSAASTTWNKFGVLAAAAIVVAGFL